MIQLLRKLGPEELHQWTEAALSRLAHADTGIMDDGSPKVRKAAIEMLGQLDGAHLEKHVSDLVRKLQHDTEREVKQAAKTALRKIDADTLVTIAGDDVAREVHDIGTG